MLRFVSIVTLVPALALALASCCWNSPEGVCPRVEPSTPNGPVESPASGGVPSSGVTFPNTPLRPPHTGVVRDIAEEYCNAPADCKKAATQPACASGVTCDTAQPAPTGFSGVCVFTLAPGCTCYDGDIRYCNTNGVGSCTPPGPAGCGISTCSTSAVSTGQWGSCKALPQPQGPCGHPGEACCGGACGGGSTCSGGTCVACGGRGQPCCAGSCTGGDVCQNGTCAAPAQAPSVVWDLDPHGGPAVHLGLHGLFCSAGLASPATDINTALLSHGSDLKTLDKAGPLAWELQSFPKGSKVEVSFSGETLSSYKVDELPKSKKVWRPEVGVLFAQYDSAGIGTAWLIRDDGTRVELSPGKDRDKLVKIVRGCTPGLASGTSHFRAWVIGDVQSDKSVQIWSWEFIEPKP